MNLEIDRVYNFSTTAPSILGTGYQKAKFVSQMNQAMAVSRFPHIVARYRQVYPLLPAGTPDLAGRTTYYVFQTFSGEEICLAREWIDVTSVTAVSTVSFNINVYCDVDQLNRIRAFLAQTGVDFNIQAN